MDSARPGMPGGQSQDIETRKSEPQNNEYRITKGGNAALSLLDKIE
jgi:hypothetical protein